MLEDQGEIRFALTGRKGLDLARHQRPDLVLLDIELGDTSGFAVLKSLHAIDGMKDVPVVFVSFHDDSLMEISALRAGAEGLISKIASPVAIRRQVQEFLLKGQAEASLRDAENDANRVPARVMLVDKDNVVSLASMASILQDLGADVMLIGDLAEIEALVEIRRCNLVIIVAGENDDEWEKICTRLMIEHPEIVVVIASNNVSNELEERAHKVGCQGVFQRNLRPLLLRSRLKNVLSQIPVSALIDKDVNK